jgi:RHS repeat-associated protein
MTDPSGLTTYGYDNRDRLTTKATPQGTLSYTYDGGSNVLTMQSSNENGVSVSYSYDELNRLSTVTDNAPFNPSATNPRPGSGTTTYRYDAVGNIGGYVYPNGVDTSYTYNTLNRLTNVTSVNAQQTALSSFTYELGAAGNRTSVTELNGRHVDYTYDALYRLKSETIGLDPVTGNNGVISYNYDAVGNRLNRTSTVAAIPTTTSSYDANDRLGGDGYDANGSTTSSAGRTYTYDFENRIISLNTGNPALNATFLYDGDGNRVAKTVSGVTTKFLVDTNNPAGYAQVVEEIVGGSVQRIYVHGHSLVSQQQLLGSPTPSWTTSFYGMDGHGSVRFLTDSTGTISDSYDYDAFGILIRSTGSTLNNFLYCAEQFDPHLGFYYLRARYMNSSGGRFFTVDPFSGSTNDPISLHRYLYANANPTNFVDPSGNVSLPVVFAVVLTVGILATTATLLYSRHKWRNSIITVGLEWTDNWELRSGDSLSGSEVDSLKAEAMRTLRAAYVGFRVLFNESGMGQRKIRIRNQRHGTALGETLNTSLESDVFLIDHRESLDAVTAENRIKVGRKEYVEALGRGLGATAAHELGHQAPLWYVFDRAADPSTYDHYRGSYELFFTQKRWSKFALDRMNDVLPPSE